MIETLLQSYNRQLHPSLIAFLKGWNTTASSLAGTFLFKGCRQNPELERHARLIVWFGLLGFLFECIYAVFYFSIGHFWGAWIIAISALCAFSSPFIMKFSRSLFWGGNLLMAIMTGQFILLCTVEGGLHGHAFAWLVCIPLCALLLVGMKGTIGWASISFLSALTLCLLALNGVDMPTTYDPRWENLVSTIGYLGLILFMFLLGMIFEIGREKALLKVSDALARLETSNKKLVHLNKEKNEFLGIAAHDMKNPLTSIMGSAEMLSFSHTEAEKADIAETILSSSHRMLDLIKNLLDTNAIEEGRLTSRIERCNLKILAAQSLENNLPYARKKEIDLVLSGQEEAWARADRGATMQILDNLISNAIKYSPQNTTVQIEAFTNGTKVGVSVTDEGPGISDEEQKLLFRKFTRLSTQPTAGESSSGLGLSIVKRLAEAMSGSVQCSSRQGRGSTFKVKLPVWEGQDPKSGGISLA